MNNKQAVIDKIMADARQNADSNFDLAKAQVEEILGKAKQEAEETISQSLQKAADGANEIKRRSGIIQKLDSSLEIQNAKKLLIDQVFEQAKEAFKKSSGYKAYFAEKIQQHAKAGDSLVVSMDDQTVFDDAFLKQQSEALGFELKLSATKGSFLGGVILENDRFDKNITLETVYGQLREKIEKRVSEILFEEKA